ncbi:MAG TPA: hypothetical protein VMV10_18495 [Pirellulales bacterium]|nr:hypothetical protein [Pirellulales bacterium]
MAPKSPKRLAAIVVAAIIAFYVGSYVLLSLGGRYEPASFGLRRVGWGVKWYEWAPSGFVTNFRWSHNLMRVYFPLYILDCRFWHPSDEAFDGIYPINEVADEDVDKIVIAIESSE